MRGYAVPSRESAGHTLHRPHWSMKPGMSVLYCDGEKSRAQQPSKRCDAIEGAVSRAR